MLLLCIKSDEGTKNCFLLINVTKSSPKCIFFIKIGAGGAEIFLFSEKLERGPGSSRGVCGAVRGGGPSEGFRGGGAAGLNKDGAHLCFNGRQ